jgi:hypothetical protein
MKPPSTPAVEIVEPASAANVVTEVKATEVIEPSAGGEQPEESRDSTPPESKGSKNPSGA